jgi:cellulose biosynthesis protein BcsQ
MKSPKPSKLATQRIFPRTSADGRPTTSDGRGLVVVVAAFKGGVGKTTTVEALMHFCGKKNAFVGPKNSGARVCLIDMDEQATLTFSFGIHPENYDEAIARVLAAAAPEKAVGDNILGVKVTRITNLVGIIPGGMQIAFATAGLNALAQQSGMQTVRDVMLDAVDRLRDYFDLILIDMPPALPALSMTLALRAGDVLVTPITDGGSADTLPIVIDRVTMANESRRLDGLKPLQMFLICPMLTVLTESDKNKEAHPLHPEHGRIPPWYRTVQKHFPQHFIDSPVRFSRRAQEAFGAAHGLTRVGSDLRLQWRSLFRNLFERIMDVDYPLLQEMLDTGRYSTDEYRADIRRVYRDEANVVKFNLAGTVTKPTALPAAAASS